MMKWIGCELFAFVAFIFAEITFEVLLFVTLSNINCNAQNDFIMSNKCYVIIRRMMLK